MRLDAKTGAEVVGVASKVVESELTIAEEVMSNERVSDEAVVGYSIGAYGIVFSARGLVEAVAVDLAIIGVSVEAVGSTMVE